MRDIGPLSESKVSLLEPTSLDVPGDDLAGLDLNLEPESESAQVDYAALGIQIIEAVCSLYVLILCVR